MIHLISFAISAAEVSSKIGFWSCDWIGSFWMLAVPLLCYRWHQCCKASCSLGMHLGATEDKSLYSASGEAFGAVKILEDSLPVVSEKGPDELSPWAHSSLRGRAFAAWTVERCGKVK